MTERSSVAPLLMSRDSSMWRLELPVIGGRRMP